MSVRVFAEGANLAAGATLALPRNEARYALRVRRSRVGDNVEVLDGAGTGFEASIVEAGDECRVQLHSALSRPTPRRHVELWLALADVDATTNALRFATQCGASSVHLVQSRHGSARGPSSERVQRVLRETLRQCGRLRAPPVHPARDLPDHLADPDAGPGHRYIAWASARDKADTSEQPGDVCTLAIGPEGGWHAEEVAALHGGGFKDLALGPHVLTTPVAVAAGLGFLLARA